MSDNPILDALVRLEARLVEQIAVLTVDQRALRTDFLAELGETRAAIMGRIDKLENRVNAIRDDIAVNMGAVEDVRRANDNTRADLRSMQDQVSVMWKQIKRLETDVRELRGDP